MSIERVINILRENKHGLFATRDSVEDAYEYGMMLMTTPQLREMDRHVVLNVYHNTLLEQVIKLLMSTEEQDDDTNRERDNPEPLQH